MAIPKCEFCDKSEDPNSQSKVGFKLSNRSVYGAPRRLLCNNCIAYLKRNKDIDFEKARLRRAGREGRLASSESFIGKCECCKRSDIEVKSRTFRRGKFRETVCEACNAHIHQHPEMNLEEIKNDRIWMSEKILKYRNSEFSPISKNDRVYTKSNGVWNNRKYECRKCGELKIIRNPIYHLCPTCTKHEEYIGESCECCYRKSDGTFAMSGEFITQNRVTKRLLLCHNCKKRIWKFGIAFEHLQKIMSIKNCQICEVELIEGNIGSNIRCIDHDHKTGKVRGVMCTNCNKTEGHISKITDDYVRWAKMLSKYLGKNKEKNDIKVTKVNDYNEIRRYRNSEYSIIKQVERVPSKDAKIGIKHICRRCNQLKKIKNITYQFCDNCVQKEEFIGETCECCNYVADGNKIMKKSNLSYMTLSNAPNIFCQDCHQKMLRFKISKYRLADLMSVTNCEICDLDISVGKNAVNKDNAVNIDHNHENGLVRGVLCPNCNKAEGYLSKFSRDPITWAKKLQKYLEENK